MSDSPNDAILEQATRIFAELGYAGARVDEIARAAGVNKATLYYRIGDKAALYAAVLDRVLGGTAERLVAAVAATDDCAEKLRRYVAALAEGADRERGFAPIMMREVASGGAHMPDQALGHMMRIVGSLRMLLLAGQERGQFRPMDPLVIHMMVIGSLMFYAAGGPIRARLAGSHPEIAGTHRQESATAIAPQVTAMVLAALQNATDNHH